MIMAGEHEKRSLVFFALVTPRRESNPRRLLVEVFDTISASKELNTGVQDHMT